MILLLPGKRSSTSPTYTTHLLLSASLFFNLVFAWSIAGPDISSRVSPFVSYFLVALLLFIFFLLSFYFASPLSSSSSLVLSPSLSFPSNFPDYFLSSSSPVCFNLFLSTCIIHSTLLCSPYCGGCSFSWGCLRYVLNV